ncbi:hypothetical protein M422DRAFT_242475, partial [Sphaerobolus stellatus SS14]
MASGHEGEWEKSTDSSSPELKHIRQENSGRLPKHNDPFAAYLRERNERELDSSVPSSQTGITFKGLRVTGVGGFHQYQETIFSVMNPLNLVAKAHKAFHPPTHEILTGITGTVRPGEMLL